MSPRTFAIIMVGLLAVAGPSIAQPPSAEDARNQAREHFERAVRAQNFGNYDDAVREYQAAFELTHDPVYLFNIGQTYRAKGDRRTALEFYKKYIEADPNGEGVASARSHIDTLEKELKAEAAAAELRRKEEAAAIRRRAAEAEAAKLAAAAAAKREAEEIARRRIAAADVARRQKSARYFRIAGLSTAGAGVAMVGVASIFGLRARSLSREASATTGMWTDEAQGKVDRARSSERTMFILLGVGGAVAITGGALYFVGRRKHETAQPADATRLTISPAPLADGGALVLQGGF